MEKLRRKKKEEEITKKEEKERVEWYVPSICTSVDTKMIYLPCAFLHLGCYHSKL